MGGTLAIRVGFSDPDVAAVASIGMGGDTGRKKPRNVLFAVGLSSPAADARRRSTPRPPTAFRYADASFRCRLALDDFRGDQPFEVRVLAGHKVVQARARGEARRPGVRLYWRGADRRWHPWGTLTTTRLRDKCRRDACTGRGLSRCGSTSKRFKTIC